MRARTLLYFCCVFFEVLLQLLLVPIFWQKHGIGKGFVLLVVSPLEVLGVLEQAELLDWAQAANKH